jgi:type IV secretory pathway ATPase VirB11/archaellum biosynthesis ATPase
MQIKRKFLRTPGQSVTITVSGNPGSGKTGLMLHIIDHLRTDVGLAFSDTSQEVRGSYSESITVTALPDHEARSRYLESLEPSQRECLRGHLDALGYEL